MATISRLTGDTGGKARGKCGGDAELVIALVVRTRRPFFRSRPGGVLLWSTLALVALTVAIPYLPFIGVIGFVPLPGMLLVTVMAITALYVFATELTKRRFFRGVL